MFRKFKPILLFLGMSIFLFGGVLSALNISRVKTWSASDVLTASDLNAEFDNIVNHSIVNADISASAAIVASKLDLTVGTPIGSTTPSTGAFSTLTATTLTATSVSDALYNLIVPSGVIQMYGGTSAPTGWLACDGSAVSQVTYANLYAVIGVTYGNPGAGNFNLPNLVSKFARGSATPGTGAGADTHVHTGPSHTHTGPSHTHSVPYEGWGYGANAQGRLNTNDGGGAATADKATAAGGTGATGADGTGNTSTVSNIPAYDSVMYIIKI